MGHDAHFKEGTTMSSKITGKIMGIFSPRTRAWLLWCLAVQAQGPTGALASTPTGIEDYSSERSNESSSHIDHTHTRRMLRARFGLVRAWMLAVVLGLAAFLALTGAAAASAAGGSPEPTQAEPTPATSVPRASSSVRVAVDGNAVFCSDCASLALATQGRVPGASKEEMM
jgi:hypothetical protein